MQNICWKLITELDIFEGRPGPWSFPDNLHNMGTQCGKMFFRSKMNLLSLIWEAMYIAFVIASRNKRKRKRRCISNGKK